MNREILFRGKHVHTIRQNEHLDGRWIYGYLCDENHINSPELEGEFLVDEDTVCQYTGLPDKNGRKIFKEDICQWVDAAYGKCTGVVRYGEWEQDGSGGEYFGTKCVGWYLEVSKVQSLMPDVYTDAEAEEMYPEWMRTISIADNMNGEIKYPAVIGNIFDNPELLKEDGDERRRI